MNRARTAPNPQKGATEHQKRSVLNLVWNCLSPIARQKFVEDKEKQSLLSNKYFEYFDLNNKVEFFGYQKEDRYESFMQKFWPLEDEEDNEGFSVLKNTSEVLRSTTDLIDRSNPLLQDSIYSQMQDNETGDDLVKKSKVLRSELLHHKYFYLSEEVDKEMYSKDGQNKKEKADIISENKTLPRLQKLVQDT